MSVNNPGVPSLSVSERDGRVRLLFGGVAWGEGRSLQEASDDLIRRLLGLVMALRASGFTASGEVRIDLETMDFLYALGEFAAAGGDIRSRVFG